MKPTIRAAFGAFATAALLCTATAAGTASYTPILTGQ